jgi:hypothetical protein
VAIQREIIETKLSAAVDEGNNLAEAFEKATPQFLQTGRKPSSFPAS